MSETYPTLVAEDIKDFPHMQNLPPVRPIAELSSDARWNSVPKELRIEDFHARGWNGIFHGREDELERLRDAYSPRQRIEESTNYQIMLMYGSQGAGKSALIRAFQYQAQAQGIAAIGLDQTAFHSDENFVNQLTESAVWQTATRMQRAGKKLQNIIANAGRAGLVGISSQIQAEMIVMGVYNILPHWLLGLGAMQLDVTPPPSPEAAVQRLDDAFVAGYVFTVDEVQRWGTASEPSAVTRLANLVGDPTHRQQQQIRTGGLVVSGLADSAQTLERLDITRTDYMHVGHLEPLAAKDTIAAHISQADAEREIIMELRDRWSEALAQQFHIWPHHTTCAARAAQRMVEEASEEWTEDPKQPPNWRRWEPLLEQAFTVAAHGARKLYDQRTGMGTSSLPEEFPVELAALAKATDNRFHVDSLQALLNLHGETDATMDDTITNLLHSGLIEPVLTETHAVTPYRRMPIPSNMDYLIATASHPPDGDRIEYAIQSGVKRPQPAPKKEPDEPNDD